MRGPRYVERIGVLVFGWVWGIGVAIASHPAVQDAQKREATGGSRRRLSATWPTTRALQPDELASAEREAARIHEAIRVRIRWVPAPEPRPDPTSGRERRQVYGGGGSLVRRPKQQRTWAQALRSRSRTPCRRAVPDLNQPRRLVIQLSLCMAPV